MGESLQPHRIGVLLAAGRGGRMGSTKQLKLWPLADGPKPLICAAFDAIRPVCDEMVIVLGHAADDVAAVLGGRPFHRATSDPNLPMFDSIRKGIQRAFEIDATATIVLHPGDHPEVGSATLGALSAWSLERPGHVLIPQYGDRGGHPTFIPARIAKQLLTAHCPMGLGQYWAEHPELCVRIPVDDATVIRDIDTPADLAGE